MINYKIHSIFSGISNLVDIIVNDDTIHLKKMKPSFEKIQSTPGLPFCFQKREKWRLNFNWHYHPEYELILIIEGKGQIFVGDNISKYYGLEFFLIGPNIPHALASDMRVKKSDFSSIIIQFIPVSIGLAGLKAKEFSSLQYLFKNASRGICFSKETASEVLDKMNAIQTDTGLLKLIDLLYVINTCANAENFQLLSNKGFSLSGKDEELSLMEGVCYYIFQNYDKEITLSDVAENTNISIPSVCRLFKKKMGSTYIKYLTTIRIAAACKYLIQTDMQIIDICYQSGFNNLSNFNRCFFKEKQLPPSEYRDRYKLKEAL